MNIEIEENIKEKMKAMDDKMCSISISFKEIYLISEELFKYIIDNKEFINKELIEDFMFQYKKLIAYTVIANSNR